MITIVKGNLLDAKEDIIAQQVNCQGVMGSGVAKQLRDKYDGLYEEYRAYCDFYGIGHNLLGRSVMVLVADGKVIANLFGQLNYGRSKYLYTDYKALRTALCTLASFAQIHGKTVAMPYNIGCGLANGDWDNVVYPMLKDIFSGLSHSLTLYQYEV